MAVCRVLILGPFNPFNTPNSLSQQLRRHHTEALSWQLSTVTDEVACHVAQPPFGFCTVNSIIYSIHINLSMQPGIMFSNPWLGD